MNIVIISVQLNNMPDKTNKKSVVIIGTGWAGLACAVELARAGYSITVLESARQIGGRARSIPFNEHTVDNGQHLLIGAYTSILSLLNIIGVDVTEVLLRQPLKLVVHSLDSSGISLSTPVLPAPFHLLIALMRAKGLGVKDKLRALQFGAKLYTGKITVYNDISVTELLSKHKQTSRLIATFWEPLCLATLNTPLYLASAKVFIKVLEDAFLKNTHNADLLIPKLDLDKLFSEPAVNFIQKHDGSIQLRKRVSLLDIKGNKVKGVIVDEQYIKTNQLVLAVSPQAALPLLEPHSKLRPIHQKLKQITYEPVTTVYLQYPVNVSLEQPIQGIIDGWSQWVFDRHVCQQPGVIAVVISSRGIHMQFDKAILAKKITSELAQLFPHWPEPVDTLVIREKRATFSCVVDINQLRPDNFTTVEGLWLAGDYTNTTYPATLEGAVRSGLECANQIIKSPEQDKYS